MYSGLLPRGLTEDDLSSDEEDEQENDVDGRKTEREKREKRESSAGDNISSVAEAQPTHAVGGADSDFQTCSMPGVPQEMWQVCRSGVHRASVSLAFSL